MLAVNPHAVAATEEWAYPLESELLDASPALSRGSRTNSHSRVLPRPVGIFLRGSRESSSGLVKTSQWHAIVAMHLADTCGPHGSRGRASLALWQCSTTVCTPFINRQPLAPPPPPPTH